MKRTFLVSLCPIVLALLAYACGQDAESPSSPTSSARPGVKLAAGAVASTDPTLGAPALQSPPTGEAVQDLQPELVIGNATGGAGTRTYTFELALDSAFTQMALVEPGVAEGLGGITRWRVTEPLVADTKYYWRVAAVTSAGAGPYAPLSEFRVREAFSYNRPTGGLVVFDPLSNGFSIGEVHGGAFVTGGWQPQINTDCLRYQVPTLTDGRVEFTTTNVSTVNPVPGKRILLSMWDPSKGDYRENPYRVNLSKLDESTVKYDDVRLRWISRGQETNVGISFFDFEPQLVYEWKLIWGDSQGEGQNVKVFLDGTEILTRNYSEPYHPNPHWVELGQCDRDETLEMVIFSNVKIGAR